MDGIDEEQYGFPLVPCGPLNAKMKVVMGTFCNFVGF